MHDHRPNTVTDAEVLSVTDGMDETTARLVVLPLRPITGSGRGCVHLVRVGVAADSRRGHPAG
jgi:hypothetical protein